MGRRKIEIQPITHERNRSVTFLKRKNGLFKKAYELGVLCSVDVAVIIFEERPGHHVKLYQYGSADIHDIVERHLRHDGEKDTRGPPDFSGNANTKLDDMGDGDDDDQDDDDDLPRSVRKRGPDGKLKPSQDLINNMDYGTSHRLSIPQPLSMQSLAPPSSGSGSTLPISSMRDPNVNKRSRIGIPSSHSRSPSDDLAPPSSGAGPYSYHPSQNSSPFNRPSNSPYQHHPSQHHPSQHHPSQQPHHQPHHHTQQGPQPQQQHHSNPQYQPFFSVSSHTSPPPSFIPLQSDFSRSSGPSSRSAGTGAGAGGGPGFGLPTRTNSSSSSYETGLYSNMIRGPSGGPSQSSGGGGTGGTSGGGSDLFAAFLDADEQTRHQSQSSQGSGFALDWPVHSTAGSSGGGNAGGNPGGGGGGGNVPSGPSTASSSVHRRS